MNKSKLMKLLERSGLKRAICIGLACILAIGGVLVGNAEIYRAATDPYKYATWSILISSPASTDDEEIVSLYFDEGLYEWKVTSCAATNGYGLVILTGINNTVNMVEGSNIMTTEGYKEFTISNLDASSSYYAKFRIKLDYEKPVTQFTGYVKIV